MTCRAGGHWIARICGTRTHPCTGTSGHDKPEQGLSQANTGAPTYLCCCIVYYFLCGQITLVPHQQLVDIFTGITVYLLQPLLDIIERLLWEKRIVSKALDKEFSTIPLVMTRKEYEALHLCMRFTTMGQDSNAAQLPDGLGTGWSPQGPHSSCSQPYTALPVLFPQLFFPAPYSEYSISTIWDSSSSCSRDKRHGT